MRPLRVGCLGELNWRNGSYALLLLITAAVASHAQFTSLHSFDYTDGKYVYAGLIQATDGNLYGTTAEGGANDAGTVFKITTGGTLATLHSFDGTDGREPRALVQATDGNLYGTTTLGGANNENGTVFKITPSGTLTTLYNFCSLSSCADGSYPLAGLVQATNGDLYGTTSEGGAKGYGTVFKVTPSGTLTMLHSYHGGDGMYPSAGLIQAADGNFYGTTHEGGEFNGGTIFKIAASGTLTTLHSFDGFDGLQPSAGLVQAANGNFYGTTTEGGANLWGTVFQITPSGTLTTLYSFDIYTDGASPAAELVQATNGDLYGTASLSGGNGAGMVFEITPSGKWTALHSFDFRDGSLPVAGLVQATNGDLYGTTYEGGTTDDCEYGCGTVFRLSTELGPFVETQTSSGRVGGAVKILGNKLTSATAVAFNGTVAVFEVASSSLITTNVPTGATTGFATVTTPSGTLKSNRKFRVTP